MVVEAQGKPQSDSKAFPTDLHARLDQCMPSGTAADNIITQGTRYPTDTTR